MHWKSADVALAHRFDNYIAFLDNFSGSTLLRTRFPYLKWDLRAHTQRDPPAHLVSSLTVGAGRHRWPEFCVTTQQDHFGFVGGRQLRLIDDWFNEHNVSTSLRPYVSQLCIIICTHFLSPSLNSEGQPKRGRIFRRFATQA